MVNLANIEVNSDCIEANLVNILVRKVNRWGSWGCILAKMDCT